MKQKLTVKDFGRYKKEGQMYTWIVCYDYTFASIVDESKTEMILVGDSLGNVIMGEKTTLPVTMDDMIHHIRAVVKGAPNTFVVGDMPFGTYNVSDDQAVINANRMMQEGGCDAVKLEGGKKVASRIRAIVDAGIPVVAHIGLTPQSISAIGGYKVQGVEKEVADGLVEDAIAVADAGAFSICLECMPSVVAKKITETLDIPTMGIGAGPYCDCQELNLYDLTGLFGDFKPKFVKQFAKLRQQMVDALDEFYEESCAGTFPTPEYSYNAKVEGYEE